MPDPQSPALRAAHSQTHPIRVLIVAPSLDILGGQAVQAARLLDQLRRVPGLVVDFLPVNPRLPAPLSRLQRVKYVRTIVTSAAYFTSLLLRVGRYDVVHAFSASYFSYLLAPLPAMVVARALGVKALLNYHSGEADDHLSRWKRSAVPTMRRFADAITVQSDYLVEVFARHGLLANAVFNFIEVDDLPYRERAAIEPVFLSNRNLEPMYGVGTVLDAFAQIQRIVPEARLLVAGDGGQRAALEEQARTLGLREVEFLGRVPPDQIGHLYDRADVFLNGSTIDNMPLSIIEAYAAGLPVVTTDAGGIPYIVRHDETGLMVPRGDAAGMATAALRLLGEPGLAARLAGTARAECLARYVWPAVEAEWVALYRRLCDNAPASAHVPAST